MINLKVKIDKLLLETPILTASGTVGHGDELQIIDYPSLFRDIGAFVTKGITLKPKKGNRPIRLAETNYGLLNAIGIQNKGVDYFFDKQLPTLRKYRIPIIINIAADTIGDFDKLAEVINNKEKDLFQGIEINVSCPNVNKGGIYFGTDPEAVKDIVQRIRKQIKDKVIITKLTPNVTNIVEIAEAAVKGGSHALSMINTMKGMMIDIYSTKPLLSNKTGGLSGPAIKPIGVRMVYECYEQIKDCKSRKVPIIGIGGIMKYEDALEYIMAGATAIGIGTAFYYSFNIFSDVKNGIIRYLEREGKKYSDIIGIAHK